MYNVCIRINETLPWIELEGTYQTRQEAREAAKAVIEDIKIKIVPLQEKRKQIKALATIR